MAATSSPLFAASPIVRRLAAIAGWLCVIATLALLGPGVVATARADEAQSAPEAGPTCRAPEETAEESILSIEDAIERIHANQVTRAVDPTSEWVVLNGRGYNYGPEQLEPEPGSAPR